MAKVKKQSAKTNPTLNSAWHKKIAASRGKQWRRNIVAGRRRVMLNPSFLRLARLDVGLEQRVFAKDLGLSTGAYGNIERGITPVKKDRADLIARKLGKPVDRLFEPISKKKLKAIIREHDGESQSHRRAA